MFDLIDVVNFREIVYYLSSKFSQVPHIVFMAVGFAVYIFGLSWTMRFLGARLDVLLSQLLRRCGRQPILGVQDSIGAVLRWLPPLSLALGLAVIISGIIIYYFDKCDIDHFPSLRRGALVIYFEMML